MSFLRALTITLAAATLGSCLPPGQRLCSLEVVRGDAVVLETNFDVSDSKGIAAIWDEAGEVPFASPVVKITPSEQDPTRARLEGEVVVRISHSTVLGEVKLIDLQLIRSDAFATDWRLPRAEIQRAKAAAGL